MKTKVLAVGSVLALCVTMANAQDSFEALLTTMLKSMTSTIETLKSVKDKESADKAIPKLRVLGKSMADIAARADKLGKPTPEQEKVMKEKYEPQMKAIFKDLFSEATRLSKEDYGKDVLKELSAFKIGKKG